MDASDPEDAAALAEQKAAAEGQALQLFETFDADDSGTLDKAEVKLLLESQGVCVTPQYLSGLLEAFDDDGNGTFDRDEFTKLAKVVISRSVESRNDVESLWYWLGLKYRYRDAQGAESAPLSIDVVQMKISRGEIQQTSPFQCQTPSGEWEPWGPLSEWQEFYEEGFVAALHQAGKRVTRPEDASDLFHQYDADGSGSLDRDEVKQLLAGLGLADDEGYVDGMLDAFDADQSGDIDEQEFAKLFGAVLGHTLEGEGSPSEGAASDSPLFWKGTQYKYRDSDGAESASLTFAAFKSALLEHPLSDETEVQVSEPGGGWKAWSTIGAYKGAHAGFIAALEGVPEGLPPDAEEGEEEDDEEDEEAARFWHGLKYRFKTPKGDVDGDSDNLAFGILRQKMLCGDIDDSTQVQIYSDGEWGEWSSLENCKQEYDGFAAAIGHAIADDTLHEYKKAFSLFDKDGDGTMSASELGTVMKALGVETTDEQLEEMVKEADADGSGEIEFNEFLAMMTLRVDESDVKNAKKAFWALQPYKWRGSAGASDWLCIGEMQELMASGELQDDTPIFTEKFDDFRTIVSVMEDEPAFAAALEHEYHQELTYVDDEQEESEDVPLADVRKLVRDGVLRDDMMVWTAGFSNWASLAESRWKFGLAEVMLAEIAIGGDSDEDEDTAEDDAAALVAALAGSGPAKKPREPRDKPREKKEKQFDLGSTAAIKLSSLAEHAGFLCREEPKTAQEEEAAATEGGGHSADDMRELFQEFDGDGSGQLDRQEIGAVMSKALSTVGKAVSDEDLDKMIKEMDGDDGDGEIGFEEFAAWWKTEEAAEQAADGASASKGRPNTKMVKRWAIVVSVNAEGKAVVTQPGQRAIVFYEGKTSLKPLGHILSPPMPGLYEAPPAELKPTGLFALPAPELSMKLVMRFPHCFGCSDWGSDGDVSVLAARAAGDRENWVKLLGERRAWPSKEEVDPNANASEIGRIFNEIDEDGSGCLDREEVSRLLARMGQKYAERSSEIFDSIDGDGSGEIELGEFEEWWGALSDPGATALIRADVGFFSFEQVLASVSRPGSPYNWVLAMPDPAKPTIFKAGSLGMSELVEWLDDTRVLYGLIRVGFGAKDSREQKLVFVKCVGSKVPADKLEADGADSLEKQMHEILSPSDLSATAEQLTDLEAFVKHVHASLGDGESPELFTLELLQAASKEDQKLFGPATKKKAEKQAAASADAEAAKAERKGSDGEEDEQGEQDGQSEDDETESEEESESEEETESEDDEDFDDSDDDEYERVRVLPPVGREATGVKVVVDEGYGSTKFGICGEAGPTTIPNVLQEGSDMRYMICREKLDAMAVDWEALETQWYQMFESELDVEGEHCSVLATISPYGSKEYAETLGELLFETFDISSIYFANPSMLSLYAQGKTTGLVLDSGECITSAFPVYEGVISKHAVKSIPFGGRDVTDYIKRQLDLDMEDYETNRVAEQMKRELCYCGEPRPVETKTYALPDGEEVTIDADSPFPYRAPEFFYFDPMRLDWEDTSLEESVQAMVMRTVTDCAIDTRKKLTENVRDTTLFRSCMFQLIDTTRLTAPGQVLLAGGNTLFDGLPEM